MPSNTDIDQLFAQYPKAAQAHINTLKNLIFTVAKENQLGKVTKSIKWGEASFCCKGGTPIRLAWKDNHPESISVYFNCQTSIAKVVRIIFGERLEVIGNREIRLTLKQKLPKEEIKFCVDLALRYHTIKHLPMLGMTTQSN